jgi:hypothetical protein
MKIYPASFGGIQFLNLTKSNKKMTKAVNKDEGESSTAPIKTIAFAQKQN